MKNGRLEETEIRKLIRFVGYGPKRQVEILFLGYEEHVRGGRTRQGQNLRARMKFKPVMDMKKAHDKFHEKDNPYHDDANRNRVKVWNAAARFALKFEGHCQWAEKEIWSEYWRNSLGRRQGMTFLMECFSVPAGNHQGIEQVLPPGWTIEKLWGKRKKVLKKHLQEYPPQFVIAYGEDTKEKAMELFNVVNKWRCVSTSRHPAFVTSNGETHIAHIGFIGRNFSRTDIPEVVKRLRKFVSNGAKANRSVR